MSGLTRLKLGSRIHFNGEVHEIVAIGGQVVTLRCEEGSPFSIQAAVVFASPDFEVLDIPNEGREHRKPEFPQAQTPKALQEIDFWFKHILDVMTGCSRAAGGDGRQARPQYDPEKTSESERLKAKALELKVSEKTIERRLKRFRERGPDGLADLRRRKQGKTRFRKFERLLREEVAALNSNSSLSISTVLDHVFKRLHEDGSEEKEIPSRAMAYNIFNRVASKSQIGGRAKFRSGAHDRPPKADQPLIADYPGQHVILDSTRTNVYVLDPSTGEPKRAVLLAAMDLYSRSVVGIRIAPSGKGVDVAQLLIEVMQPKPASPLMSEYSRWRVIGVSEQWIQRYFPHCAEAGVAGIPFVYPENVTTDRGADYLSKTTHHTASVMGCNLLYARPGVWIDKSALERFFGTIGTGLFERLPAYTGRDVTELGPSASEEALLHPAELEDIIYAWIAEVYQRRVQPTLHAPRAPDIAMSPNEMYEEGVQRVGFLCAPSSGSVRLMVLPREFRTVQSYGVRIRSLTYDSAALDSYRVNGSRHGSGKKWPFRVDPRDVTRIYFEDPDTGTLHEIPWIHWPDSDIPCPEATVAYVRRRLASRGKGDGEHLIRIEFAHILERFLSGVKAEREEQRMMTAFSFDALRVMRDKLKVAASSGRNVPVEDEPLKTRTLHTTGLTVERVAESRKATTDEVGLQPLGSFGDRLDEAQQ